MKRISAVGIMMAVALAACDDGPAASTGDEMTEQEAAAILATVRTAGDGAYGQLSAQSGQLTVNAMPTTITVAHESNHPCPQGGSVAAELNATLQFDEETQSSGIDAEGSLTHSECAVRHRQLTLTIDGDPRLSFELHAGVENGEPVEFSQSASGALNWSASDGRSGRCVIEYSHVINFSEGERVIEGEVCGHTVRQVTTWTTN